MASIKVKFKNSSADGKEGAVYYQVIHGRAVRQIKSSCKIFPEEWDMETSSVKIPPTVSESRSIHLRSISEKISYDIRKFRVIISMFENSGRQYTADEIISTFIRSDLPWSVCSFMQGIINQMKSSGKVRTAETYCATLKSFMKYMNGKNMMVSEISPEVVMKYEWYLKKRGITRNTSSFYMRILRATYNRAVNMGIAEQRNPFKNVYTGVDKTVKRAISIEDIKKIKELDLKLWPATAMARDMFLFSFYTRGMSFVDMSYLKKTDLKYGILTYRRRKTGKLMSIKWEKCMQDIADKYFNETSPFLLPIIKSPEGNDRKDYRNAIFQINRDLKKVGAMTRLSTPLTTYVARHSWASIARSKNIPISVISESMGHDDEATTRIYLASLDTSAIDRANNIILKSLQ